LHKGNLYDGIPTAPLGEELLTGLVASDGLRIMRIVSDGQASAEDFWYEQDDNEWVLLLKGEAVIELESGKTQRLTAGDYVFLPAGEKHRVASTSKTEKTIWLAVHFD
jgi:cupin 2 domain-containing protein